jgi:hypothetical protein
MGFRVGNMAQGFIRVGQMLEGSAVRCCGEIKGRL